MILFYILIFFVSCNIELNSILFYKSIAITSFSWFLFARDIFFELGYVLNVDIGSEVGFCLFVFVLELHLMILRGDAQGDYSWFFTLESLLVVIGVPEGYRGLNLNWLHVRLYYFSGPEVLFISLFL